ncbi:hypothetical protein FACS1894130_05140 [Spirochaetia bacterium]|nr:hypothetical protein FACS1894130_05140 [Spirochaetia bacterium]
MSNIDYSKIREENVIKYGTDIGRIGKMLLADRYADKTHFIFELLQNAEDAMAKKQGVTTKPSNMVTFQLSKDTLSISHSGKPFDEADVRGICGIAESTKNELTAIGRFGIGFKSVYSYTDLPEIHSGNEHFTIEKYVLPECIKEIPLDKDETRIILPLNQQTRLKDHDEIANGIQQINLNSLLFLHYIESITWSTDNGNSGIFVRHKPNSLDNNVREIELTKIINGGTPHSEKWLVFSKKISNEKIEASVEIAFSLNGDKIQPIADSKLVVFFPTILTTYLGFLVQGPYRTTPSRDNVPTNDEWNQKCVKTTNSLVLESLRWLRIKNRLNIESLRCFPINKSNFSDSNMFSCIFHTIKKAFKEEFLLPSYNENYVSASQALLARTKEMRELFQTSDISTLFGGSYKWIHEDVSIDKTPDIRIYLMNELEVEEVQAEKLINKLSDNVNFLKSKDNKWMCQLYEFLNKQKSAFSKLKGMPIIRLLNLEHAPAFINNELQVFLPGSNTDFPTVHPETCNTDESLEFLKALGIILPNQVEDIKRNILKRFDERPIKITQNEYEQIVPRILEAFNTDSKFQQDNLIAALKSTYFIAAIDTVTDKSYFIPPEKAYFNTDSFRNLFKNVPEIYFINDEWGLKGEKCRPLLVACGVERNFRLIPKPNAMPHDELHQLRIQAGFGDCTYSNTQNDNTIYGLEPLLHLMNTLDKKEKIIRSKLIWNELCRLYERRHESVFLAEHSWSFSQRNHNCYFDTYFIRLLNTMPWIPDSNGRLQIPGNISFKSLDWEGNLFLLSKIHFKTDEIQAFEEKNPGKKVVDENLYKELMALKAEKEAQEEKKGKDILEGLLAGDNKFIPEVAAEDTEPVVTEYEGKDTSQPVSHSSAETEQTGRSVADKVDDPSNHPKPSAPDPEYISVEGKWGQDVVYKELEKEYKGNVNIEIIDLNAKGKTGYGADFIIEELGKKIKYIEVKSTKGTRGTPVEVSCRQWDAARHYFNIDHGDEYWIYCVFEAGYANPPIVKVQNPYQKWKDGKLQAHPVNFLIS